jgi:hypothetical protein
MWSISVSCRPPPPPYRPLVIATTISTFAISLSTFSSYYPNILILPRFSSPFDQLSPSHSHSRASHTPPIPLGHYGVLLDSCFTILIILSIFSILLSTISISPFNNPLAFRYLDSRLSASRLSAKDSRRSLNVGMDGWI